MMCGRPGEPAVRKGAPCMLEEDLILVGYISQHGEGSWDNLTRSAGLNRNGKSCRLWWLNYLRPGLRRGSILPEEEMVIRELHARLGNKWAEMAKHLPGRTDNEVKNYWRTRIHKKPPSCCPASMAASEELELNLLIQLWISGFTTGTLGVTLSVLPASLLPGAPLPALHD
ncbi:hypothetical protein ACQ4PT_016649 [Festuca glaucescens]